MNSSSSKVPRIARSLRGVARVWSVLVFLLALILVVGTKFAPPTGIQSTKPLDALIPLSLLISMIGLAVAWRWEGWGALINLFFYLAVVPLYWLLHREGVHLSTMVGLSPVILPGILFAVAWLLDRRSMP